MIYTTYNTNTIIDLLTSTYTVYNNYCIVLIAQSLSRVMADREILNLHSKKTAFKQNSKLQILPVRCQINTLLKSEGEGEVNFLIIVPL